MVVMQVLLGVLHAPGFGPMSVSSNCDSTVQYMTQRVIDQDTITTPPPPQPLPLLQRSLAVDFPSNRSTTTPLEIPVVLPNTSTGTSGRTGRNVIAILTDKFDDNMAKLFNNVDLYFEDNFNTSFLIFHTGYPNGE